MIGGMLKLVFGKKRKVPAPIEGKGLALNRCAAYLDCASFLRRLGGQVIAERAAFCQYLKQAREASGLTLEAISEASKIQVSLLAGLETGDLSRWPSGIFRRAFVREYATAVGLRAEQVVNDVERLFPDDGTAVASFETPPSIERSGGLRLTLALDSRSWVAPSRTRVLAATFDLLTVLVIGAVALALTTAPYWTVTGVIALLYYSLTMALAGTTPGSAWMTDWPQLGWRGLLRRPSKPTLADGPRLVFRRRDLPQESAVATLTLDETSDDAAEESTRQNLRAASS
jgi:transcriptional regulator with XRE-family HTH domain